MASDNSAPKNENAIKVMVVDDSAVIRGLFSSLLDSDPDIEVVATARDGAMAINTLSRQGSSRIDVDVITLDIQMPEMDGLEALPKIKELRPDTKVIMASTLTKESAEETMKALELGAEECLAKPDTTAGREALHIFTRELLNKVKVLGGISRNEKSGDGSDFSSTGSLKSAGVTASAIADTGGKIKLRSKNLARKPYVLAVGSSTGGPQALVRFFAAFKGRRISIPILVTQHMPPQFTALLAKQITEASEINCAEAEDGEIVIPGRIYIAPGDYHMEVKKRGENVVVSTNQNPPENFCRPAVDPMLRSVAKTYGPERTIVVILTGMGSDGYLGCKEIAEKGGAVIAQDEKTSVVWGMPGAVATNGICVDVLPLDKIPESLISLAQGQIQ